MAKTNYLKLSFNLDLPCVGAIIYEVLEDIKDFANHFANCPYSQGHHNVVAL